MIKEEIVVPKGISYVNQIEDFQLPNGILNKGITNCGATTLALEDKHKTIICSPRNNLIVNKHEQYGETMLVIGGCKDSDIRKYIESKDVPKILVSYDSFPKVIECIDDKSEWRIVVDEFQYLLADSSFKSETELRFMECLKQFNYVTYLSATPILDKYISQIDFFKDIPYYYMTWQEVEKVKVIRQRTARPIDAAVGIVNSYRQGIYPYIEMEGVKMYSKECVIFLNSVTNILDIIKKTGLSPDDVNIIVGNSAENDAQISKLGDGFIRGRIPLKEEKNKMFTFCTSTAFAGCDFYSNCATSFVISDGKRVNTTIDISTDLVQIAGRQRLKENPFRKHLVFIYNKSSIEKSKEEFEYELQQKVNLTNAEIESNNLINDAALREKRIKDVCRIQKMLKYDESFIMYDKQNDKFTFNYMALLSERYSYDLQKYNYENGIVIRNQLEQNGFDVSARQYYVEYEKQLEHFIKKETFAERMESYCMNKDSGNPFEAVTIFLENKYPQLKLFYDELGGERIKALGYKECNLKNEIALKNMNARLRNEFILQLSHRTLNADTIKAVMNGIYAKFGLKKKGKVSDLQELYGLKVTKHRPTVANGKREYVYQIE